MAKLQIEGIFTIILEKTTRKISERMEETYLQTSIVHMAWFVDKKLDNSTQVKYVFKFHSSYV